jgi:acetyl-CoA C-acetyltransferase
MLVGNQVRRVAVLGGVRIPFARSSTAYINVGNQDMLTAVLRGLVERFKLQGQRLGDVVGGAVLKHSRDFNLVREALLSTTLHPETPGLDIQRACGTSLEAAILVANKIAFRKILMAASRGRSTWQRIAPFLSIRPGNFRPVFPGVEEPRTGLSMGQSCELMAKTWKVTRAEQDQLAYESHLKAAAAWKAGFFNDLVVPYEGLTSDNNVRADISLEKRPTLRPAFDPAGGTLTAGNSTPLTDGASAVLLASEEWARARGLPVQAWITYGKAWAVDFAAGKEGLLMAPAYAVPAMLKDAGVSLQDFDFYEIHEAFAAQVLCTLKAWESAEFCRERLGLAGALGSIDRAKLNVKGSSVAVGHPFAATGGRIVATLAKILATTPGAKRGLISVCTAGGMGVTAILERA